MSYGMNDAWLAAGAGGSASDLNAATSLTMSEAHSSSLDAHQTSTSSRNDPQNNNDTSAIGVSSNLWDTIRNQSSANQSQTSAASEALESTGAASESTASVADTSSDNVSSGYPNSSDFQSYLDTIMSHGSVTSSSQSRREAAATNEAVRDNSVTSSADQEDMNDVDVE